MKLKKLTLHTLPGFRHGFEIADIDPGLNIITGPNASGKTTICQAVRRLLWPGRVKQFLSASIHSEWSYDQDTFTIEVKDGNPAPNVSQAGRSLLDRLPEEYLFSCFSMTIDELFDGKDQEFAQRISQEIAGGYDVEAAQKCFLPSHSIRTAIKEWEEAEARFEQYRRTQDGLRKESEELPAFELAIEDAKAANSHVSSLEKIIDLKIVRDKISDRESSLKKFPSQLIESKIRATDWNRYEQLFEKHQKVREESDRLEREEKTLEEAVGKWRETTLAEGELDRQMDRIVRIQQLQGKKNEIMETVSKLESAVKEHRRLLGIAKDGDIERIQVEYLDSLEEDWEALTQLDSKISGIEVQIRLNDMEKNSSSEVLGQAARLLSEIASSPSIKLAGYWTVTGMAFALTCALFFFLTGWMRLLACSPLIPLGFLWIGIFRNGERNRQLKSRYNALGVPLPKEWTPPAILQQLDHTVMDWGKACQAYSQLQRKKEMESALETETRHQTALREALVKQAQAAGISHLPVTRYRFAGYLRSLHNDWVKLKEARISLERITGSLDGEWKDWSVFIHPFQDMESSNVHELVKIHARIKSRIDTVARLKKKTADLENSRKISRDLEDEISRLLLRTECPGNPDHLQSLVGQLDSYQQAQSELDSLENQFKELSSRLGPKRSARIGEEIEVLENEKRYEEEKAKALPELSARKGNLKGRIEQMEAATDGERLLWNLNHALERVRLACRDFAKKELMEFLIGEAQKDFQRECQPAVLEKAVDWFQQFTKNRFRLEAPSTHTGSIVYEVIETSTGERRTLDQLSRGTRMQLLMSVRLAFAFHSEEKSIPLPIFLDEVLANTDPDRFDAVAEVIARLVDSGRQIFYLTCNPEDVYRWKKRCPDAHVVDLAQVHGQQAFLRAPLPVPKKERIPKPSSQSIDAYVTELELPFMRIDQPIEMVPVHYLLDSANDLYRLLHSGIETYGNLIHMKPEWIENGFPDSAALIARRRQLLEKFFILKTRGRGKALSREILQDGGLSPIFINRIWELAQEMECSAKNLTGFLEDRHKKDDRKKGLRTEDREHLKDYLLQHGYLDERPILADDEIRCELLPFTIEEQDRLFIEKLLLFC